MIEVQSLTKHFGPIVAVDGISFSARPGEVLGFLGPNGAGKSTTMKMIVGFLAPTSGSSRVSGFDVAEYPIEVKRRVGYLPEGAPLYADMTPAGFLHFVASARGFSGADRAARVAHSVARTELGSVLDRPIDTLSKGFKRRVGLAQALLHDPEVLILDEPTDGLDPNQKHEVRALIREMAPKKTIVISTHLLDEVAAICSRAIVIAGGRLIADSTPGELEASSRFHNAVMLTLRGTNAAAARAKLATLQDVASIEELAPGSSAGGQGRVSLRLFARERRPIVTEVSRAVLEAGWAIEEIKVEQGQLDDVFRAITVGRG